MYIALKNKKRSSLHNMDCCMLSMSLFVAMNCLSNYSVCDFIRVIDRYIRLSQSFIGPGTTRKTAALFTHPLPLPIVTTKSVLTIAAWEFCQKQLILVDVHAVQLTHHPCTNLQYSSLGICSKCIVTPKGVKILQKLSRISSFSFKLLLLVHYTEISCRHSLSARNKMFA